MVHKKLGSGASKLINMQVVKWFPSKTCTFRISQILEKPKRIHRRILKVKWTCSFQWNCFYYVFSSSKRILSGWCNELKQTCSVKIASWPSLFMSGYNVSELTIFLRDCTATASDSLAVVNKVQDLLNKMLQITDLETACHWHCIQILQYVKLFLPNKMNKPNHKALPKIPKFVEACYGFSPIYFS